MRAANEMRNALAHGYFQVDVSIVWKALSNDLRPLRQQIEGAEERNQGQGSDNDLAL